MMGDRYLHASATQAGVLCFARVATGGLLVWSGLRRLVRAWARAGLSGDAETVDIMGQASGFGMGALQLAIGVLCVIGLWRRLVLPAQALIHGSTAASVWWAIIDPYRWYISGVDRIVFNSHVFYPTIITFAACLLLIVFRPQDRFSLDHLREAKGG